MAVANLLAERRPHRADAARNFDAILAAGRKAFAAGGTDVSLDEVARQAASGWPPCTVTSPPGRIWPRRFT